MFYEDKRSIANNYVFNDECIQLFWPLHFHNSYELFYVLDGEISLTILDTTYTLTKNQVALIFPNQAHSYNSPNYSKSVVYIFSDDHIMSFHNEYSSKIPHNPVFSLDSTDELHKKLFNSTDIYLRKSILYSLVSQLNKNTSYMEKSQTNTDFAYNTISYIQENFSSSITLKSLADHLRYDYSYVSTLINKSFNKPFADLVNEYRVSYAQKLLKNAKVSITDISIACGFNTIRSFNRNFYKHTGKTPTEYRNSSLDI